MKLLNYNRGYYSLERMISLKLTKTLLEFCKSANHVYRNEHTFVIDKITLPRMQQSTIDQLESLIKETAPARPAVGEFFLLTTMRNLHLGQNVDFGKLMKFYTHYFDYT